MAINKKTKIFLFDSLLDVETLENLIGSLGRVVSIKPAIASGNLYKNSRTYFAVKSEDIISSESSYYVIGGIVSLEMSERAWYDIDMYEGCSLARLGRNTYYDLNHRVETSVYPLRLKSKEAFKKQDFEVFKRKIYCHMYYANANNQEIVDIVKHRRNRIGVVTKYFMDLFYKED
jgi:hypothetical protein